MQRVPEPQVRIVPFLSSYRRPRQWSISCNPHSTPCFAHGSDDIRSKSFLLSFVLRDFSQGRQRGV